MNKLADQITTNQKDGSENAAQVKAYQHINNNNNDSSHVGSLMNVITVVNSATDYNNNPDPVLGGQIKGPKIEVDPYERFRRKIGSVVEMTKGGDKEKIKEALHAHKHEQELQRISTNRSK